MERVEGENIRGSLAHAVVTSIMFLNRLKSQMHQLLLLYYQYATDFALMKTINQCTYSFMV